MTSEILHLVFNDFGSNIYKNWLELRDDTAFCDVTLACEGSRVEAHKVILSTCSPVIKDLLIQANHPHPLLFFRGVKQAQITALLEFIYKGEVNLAREELDDFLEVAKELKIKGLAKDDRQIKEYTDINKPQKNPGHIWEKSKDTSSLLYPSIVKEEYERILCNPHEESSFEPQIKMEEQDYYEEDESYNGESNYLPLAYKCDICSEIVSRSGNDYKNHLQLVHGKNLHCPECLEKKQDLVEQTTCLILHNMDDGWKPIELVCHLEDCDNGTGTSFKLLKYLHEHCKKKHNMTFKSPLQPDVWGCIFCLRDFKEKLLLQRHLRRCQKNPFHKPKPKKSKGEKRNQDEDIPDYQNHENQEDYLESLPEPKLRRTEEAEPNVFSEEPPSNISIGTSLQQEKMNIAMKTCVEKKQ